MSNAILAQTMIMMSEMDNPAEAIIKGIGRDVIDAYQLFEDDILLWTYIAPSVTAGGIIKPQSVTDEDRYQGKAGLLLKMGPTAFKYDRSGAYEASAPPPDLGSWLVYRPSDAWEVALGKTRPEKGIGNKTLASCRIIRSSMVRGVISDPSWIW